MFKFNLQAFADEGMADSSPATSTAEVSGDASLDTSQTATDTEDFDTLIQGKYKDAYDAKVKAAIDRRFRNAKDWEGRYNQAQPIIEMMAEKYGMDVNAQDFDLKNLTNAITNDKSMYEEEAFQRGMDVETLKQQKALERENRQLRAIQERQAREDEGRRQWDAMQAMAQQVRGIYPSFDLDAEMQNETFGRVLATLNSAGVADAMRTAYEVVHKDEILATGMQYATNQTKEMISKSIASGARRPSEGALSNTATAAVPKQDPRTMKLEDFARMREAAQRGEIISF